MPSFTCAPFTAVTITSIGPWANNSPTGVLRSTSFLKSIFNTWPRLRNLLKGELTRRGINYEELAKRLKAIGVNETPDNLRTKINRGTFSAFFMLEVLHAIGVKALDVHID